MVSQEIRDGRLFTTLKFVETAREDKIRRILEKEYTVEGKISPTGQVYPEVVPDM